MSIKHLLLIVCITASAFVTAKSDSAYLYVLGVAQDAGYPQAGCYQPHCMRGWQNPELRRGATSIALIDPVAKIKVLFEATLIYPSSYIFWKKRHPQHSISLTAFF